MHRDGATNRVAEQAWDCFQSLFASAVSTHTQFCSDSNQQNTQISIYLAASRALFGVLNLGALGFDGAVATDAYGLIKGRGRQAGRQTHMEL